MKPLKLTMTAFGPYADKEVVDFRLLGESAFFLIHGPTGAGKTTILDAMCYALFGVTSGSERSGKQMRSTYVDPSVATEIVFDFALGGEVYRIRRRPEQEVLKKRGSGTTKLPPEAALWKRTGLEDDDAEGTVLAGKTTEVTETVENLLGFKHDQFRQVVMLPQGEFRRLLLADSRDREAIMEKLFQTELYRRIEEFLKQAARSLEKDVAGLNDKKSWLLQEAGAASADELTAVLTAVGERQAELARGAAKAREALAEAQAALVAAERLQEQFAGKRQAEAELAELSGRAEAVDGWRRELALARQAALLTEAADQVSRREAEVLAAEAKLVHDKEMLAAAREAAGEASGRLTAELAKEEERAAAQARLLELEAVAGRAGQLAEAATSMSQAEAKAYAARNTLTAAKESREAAAVKLKGLQGERDRLTAASLQAAPLAAAARETEQLLNWRRQLDAMRGEWQEAARQQSELEGAVRQLEEALTAARGEYEELERRWRHGQAAELAQGLKEGEACPVCGSAHHPAPAVSTVVVPAGTVLEGKRQAMRTLEADLEGRRRKLTEAAVTLEGVKTRGSSLKEQLGEAAQADIASLQASALEAAAGLKAAQTAAADLAACEQAIVGAEAELTDCDAALATAEGAAKEAEAVAQSARAVLAEREAAVPPSLRRSEGLAAAKSEAQAALTALQQSLEAARTAAERSAGERERAEATCGEAERQLADMKDKLAAERQLLGKRIEAAGFAGESEFRGALREQAGVARLEQAIKDHDTALALAGDRLARATAATSGLDEPDTAAFSAATDTARTAYEGLIAEQATLQESAAKQQDWLTKLAALDGELAGREEEYATLGRLAEVANGQNPLRVSFHRFVLQALMDDVMSAANCRLKKMSRGRYALRRMADPLHRGMAGGLDIEVEDSYTGVSRHVATLSGGETFLASLALALGLADVVQSYSGGIYLDTVFVDEGFGTLDPESLDKALQALIELQTRGRLVGVISHVPELKERIDARLEIIAGERGSTTRWSVWQPTRQSS
jgi:exonuclease SbcC